MVQFLLFPQDNCVTTIHPTTLTLPLPCAWLVGWSGAQMLVHKHTHTHTLSLSTNTPAYVLTLWPPLWVNPN